MKRTNYLIEKIADPDNLRLAFWKAQKGKSEKTEVVSYRNELDKNLMLLREQILSGDVSVGKYYYFKIFDPKERQICAAAFDERVLHHALMNACHDTFEKYQIFDSYACRIGKGTFAALNRAKYFQKKYQWFLKLDVRKYFDNIDHEILKNRLQNRFNEKHLLLIFEKIIDSYSVENVHDPSLQTGIPIGNLTSQYFANHYLAFADRYLKETVQMPAYVRYMDDMALWSNNKTELLEVGKKFENFISDNLHLQLKPFCLNATEQGMPFCGYMFFPDKIRLKSANKKRFITKIELYQQQLDRGEWSQKEYQNHIIPMISHVKYADTFNFRQQIIKDNNRRSSNRVNRGGSWNNNATNCRVANRNNNTPDNRNNNLGFRLVLP
jgi:retron-type reverse transcriptase